MIVFCYQDSIQSKFQTRECVCTTSVTDLLVLSSRVQVQLFVRPNTLRHYLLCISQPLAEVIHVAVELPPLLYSAIKAPASGHRVGSFTDWYEMNGNYYTIKL